MTALASTALRRPTVDHISLTRDPAGSLEIATIVHGDTATLQLAGALDRTTGPALTKAMCTTCPFLRVDVSRVTSCDAAGLGALLAAHDHHLRVGGTIQLTGLTERFAGLLSRTDGRAERGSAP